MAVWPHQRHAYTEPYDALFSQGGIEDHVHDQIPLLDPKDLNGNG